MNNITKLSIAVLGLTALIGCKQDPYSGTLNPGETTGKDNPANKQETPKVFSIEAPDSIECTESIQCNAEIIGHVPAPGKAVIVIKGLPAGAAFDATTGQLAYTPGYDVVDVSKHPEQSLVSLPLTVIVRSTADQATESSRLVTVLVKNKMQAVQLKVEGSELVSEGGTLEQTVTVNSPDFPQGPFSLTALGAPVGTDVRAVMGNPNQFTVRFTPGFLFVKNDRSNTLKLTYSISLPVGQAVTKDLSWEVSDVRQVPAITAPDALTQGLDVGFSIRAEDMNGEGAPQIKVSNSIPFGRLASTTVLENSGTGVSLPTKVVQVRWDQLKTSNLGTTTPIKYEVCVKGTSGAYSSCTQKQVMVTLKADLHAAPKIDRAIWNVGDLKFFRSAVPMTFKMPILDSEDSTLPVDVKIDSNQAGAVTWKNGMLTVNPKAEGILQFTLSAESIFGQKAMESFVVEAYPATWAKTVIFTSDVVQNEALETSKLISSVELLSAKYQVSTRTLALRENAVITTEALGMAKIDEALQNKIDQNTSSILVSSPLAGNLKGKLADELKNYGIKIKGRFSQIVLSGSVNSMTLAVDSSSSLESSKVPAGLKGALTSESADPLIFDLDQVSSKCTALFNLQKPGFSLPVGVTCKGSDGRLLTVLGFELGDVLLDAKDAPLLQKWTNTLLTGKAN